jgi:hypothetical protein
MSAPVDLTAAFDQLADLRNQLVAATDATTLAAEQDETLKPYGADGPWRYAPASDRMQALRDLEAAQGARSGEALFRLEHSARALELRLTPLIEREMEPPGIEDALALWTGRPGVSVDGLVNLQILGELRQQRLERELAAALPSEFLVRYSRALEDPFEQEHASVIRLIEGRWPARKAATLPDGLTPAQRRAEAQATLDLASKITATRNGRISPHYAAGQRLIAESYALADQVKALRRVRSQRPRDWGAA